MNATHCTIDGLTRFMERIEAANGVPLCVANATRYTGLRMTDGGGRWVLVLAFAGNQPIIAIGGYLPSRVAPIVDNLICAMHGLAGATGTGRQ